MKFKGAKGALWLLPKWQTTHLISFKALYWGRVMNNDPMLDELLTMTHANLEDYEQNLILKWLDALDNPDKPDEIPLPPDSKTSNLLSAFNKGIWRDPNSFLEIKSIEQWDNCQWVFITTTQAQGVSNVLNLKYNPGSATTKKLFNAHQTYVYSMFLLKVKESFLKDIVINQNNRQVQDIWEEITFACENSTSVEIKANVLLQYITSIKYDDGKWRGTLKAFIIHWCKQLWQYNQLSSKAGTVACLKPWFLDSKCKCVD